MDRRNFLKTTGQAAVAAPILTAATRPSCKIDDELFKAFVTRNDESIDSILEQQQNDSSELFFGGFGGVYGLFPAGKAAWYANRMICGFVSEGSKHFQSPSVANAITRAARFLKSIQHGDGTIDLHSTNFHSPPDTGFVVEPVALSLSIARKFKNDLLKPFEESTEEFLKAAGQAMAVGGIHTPNHRWVVCMALARIHDLLPRNNLVRRINQWLNEKIDIDSEGHYAERSTSIYSPLVNRCLITIDRLQRRPDLLKHVRKNLDLSQYLVRANGEIVTEVSRRQDQFRVSKMGNHYYSYRQMALKDSNEKYSAMAKLIEHTVGIENLSGMLPYLLDEEPLSRQLPAPEPLPTNYRRTFSKSKIVRIRREQMDCSIIADNETFLTFQKGNAALRAVRFATAFFGKGQFNSTSIQGAEGTYKLSQTLKGPYYQPLPQELLPGDGDWLKMNKASRPQSEIQVLHANVTIQENNGSVAIQFDIGGTDRVPLAIELAFDHAGEFDNAVALEDIADAFLMTSETCNFTLGEDKIRIQGAKSKHTWTQIRGGLPKLDAKCLYVTGFTPFQFVLKIS